MNSFFKFKYLLTGTLIGFLFFFSAWAQDENNNQTDTVVDIQDEMNPIPSAEASSYEVKSDQNINILDLLGKTGNPQQLNIILAPIRKMSETDLKNIILSNQQAHPLFEFMSKHPKLLLYVIRLLKDDQALIKLVDVTNQKKKIYGYLVFLILSMLLNHLIKIKIIKNIESIMQRFFVHIFRIIFFISFRFTVFLLLFYDSLKPSIAIFYSLG